ncbi:ABC transporter substrate-binding protein [Nocardiopsis sp. HUAS JQ3]|uniref:ABC transporter substrate-binding protein n=1 Tax=Nocardiopsis sp. HUAS JQ3 TaxID=3061629 RepID=UPI0023A95C0C|nr:ABC transporter substrate-binding protein [Nocardiopsis sp. HUAS JQ3]WDZ92769.1 ABC transporter substrate-binding protein [Nocardiopsis sp. HUAS JQ3]
MPTLKRRSLLRAGLLSAAAAGAVPLLGACAAPSSGAAKVQDTEEGTASAVLRPIAERFGLEEGLDLEYVAGTGPGDVQNKLLSGALDVSSFGPIGAAVSNAAGADVVLFGPGLNNHVRWLVAENSPYRTPADLRGKAVATPPNNSDAYRSTQLASAVNGIDFEAEYTIHQGAVLNGLALFERGDVEAIVTIEPNATRLVGRGARQIATVDDLWRQGSGQSAPLVLNAQGALRSWVEENGALASGLVRMRQEVHQRIHDEPGLLAELHEHYGIGADETEAIALLPDRLVDTYPLEWGNASFDSFQAQLDRAVELGIIESPPEREVFVDLGADR